MEDLKTLAFFAGMGIYAAKKIADPSLEFVGNRLRDHLFDTTAEAARVAGEAGQMLAAAGKQPSVVPGRILWPLLENASVDASGELRSRWAAMLANASLDPSGFPVEFPEILSQLSPLDVAILDDMASRIERENEKYTAEQRLFEIANVAPSVLALRPSLTNLERQMLVVPSETNSAFDMWDDDFIIAEKRARLTRYGVQFIVACRPPGSKNLLVTNAPHPQK